MTPQQVVKHYGSGKVGPAAYALQVARQTVYDWVKRNRVPGSWQIWIERDTQGLLKADPKARP